MLWNSLCKSRNYTSCFGVHKGYKALKTSPPSDGWITAEEKKALDRSKYASYEPCDLGQVHPSLTLFPWLSLTSRSWHMPCTLHRCNVMTREGKDMKRALQIMEQNASTWWGLLSGWVLTTLKQYVKEGTQLNMLRNQGGTLGWRLHVWENQCTVKLWSVIINWAILHRPSSLHSVFSLKSVTFYVSLNCWKTTLNWIEHPSPPCWCNQTRFTLHSQSSWLAFSSAIQVKHSGLVNIQGLHSGISQWFQD